MSAHSRVVSAISEFRLEKTVMRLPFRERRLFVNNIRLTNRSDSHEDACPEPENSRPPRG